MLNSLTDTPEDYPSVEQPVAETSENWIFDISTQVFVIPTMVNVIPAMVKGTEALHLEHSAPHGLHARRPEEGRRARMARTD